MTREAADQLHAPDQESTRRASARSCRPLQLTLFLAATSLLYGVLFTMLGRALPWEMRGVDHASLFLIALAFGLSLCLPFPSLLGQFPLGLAARSHVYLCAVLLVFHFEAFYQMPYACLLLIPSTAVAVLILDGSTSLPIRIALALHGILLVAIAPHSIVFSPPLVPGGLPAIGWNDSYSFGAPLPPGPRAVRAIGDDQRLLPKGRGPHRGHRSPDLWIRPSRQADDGSASDPEVQTRRGEPSHVRPRGRNRGTWGPPLWRGRLAPRTGWETCAHNRAA